MAKTLRTAALVVGAVALVATGVGALASIGALGAAAAGTAGVVAGISTATIATIGTFAAVGAAALGLAAGLAAPKPSVSGSGTTFTTNPQSGLPYAIGRTRMSGLRIFARTNTTPGYTKFNDLLWFGALLSIGGPIEGIEKFTADNELVTFNASGHAVGRFANYMSQKVHLGGAQASGLAVTLNGGTPPGWTSAHRLSGMTHAMWGLRFNKEGQLYGAGAPEPAWIGKWVKIYDPRLDSTYPGGSGACRALIESTYVWSQNPGLHALTWALGRWQNGLRTCGIGAPIENIRVQEFVECANICDANGWKVGGVEWTTDSKWDTFKRILQAGGAVPTQTGAMIGCLVSTPRTAIATIEAYHLLDRLSFPSTKSRRDRFNTVIPRYVDEASDWSLISGAKIQVGDYVTADRGQRTKEVDFPLVQVFSGEEAVQPGQLAAYCIVNSREAGPFSWTTGPQWAGLKTGDVIYLNVPDEGLVNQPILITKRAPDPATGKINFTGDTETYSKHSFALGQSTTPPSPFALTAPDLVAPAPQTSAWSLSGSLTGEGLPCLVLTGAPEHPSAEAVLVDYRVVGDLGWTKSAILPATETVLHVIAPLASETLYEVRIGYRVGAIDGLYTVLPAVLTGAGKLSTIEQGATNGAPVGSPIAGYPAESVIADLESATETIAAEVMRAALWRGEADTVIYLPDGTAVRTVVEAIGTNVNDITTYVAFLKEVGTDGTAKFLFAANAGGDIVGIEGTAGGGLVPQLSFVASRFLFVDDGGTNRINALVYEGGVWKFHSIEVDTLKVGSVIRQSISPGAVTDSASFSAPDVTVTSAGETTLIETPFFTVGDELYGKALAGVSLLQDGTSNYDTGMRVRSYIDTGGGYVLVRDKISGMDVDSGNARFAFHVGYNLRISSNEQARIKVTGQASNLPSGYGTTSSSVARDINIDLFRGNR